MKKLNTFLIILGILIVIIAVLVWWQYDNIKSVYYSFKYNNEQIDDLINKHYDEIDKYLKEHSSYNVRPSTEVEQKLHRDKLITDKEFENILMGENDIKSIFGTELKLDKHQNFIDSNGNIITKDELNTEKKETDNPNSDNNQKSAQSIAKMYVLKSNFEAELDSLYNEAIAYYQTLSPEQQKNGKSELIKKFYSTALSLEKSCDAQVNEILSDLESALKESGESTELVTKIQTAYTEEKSLKKAYYMNMYK